MSVWRTLSRSACGRTAITSSTRAARRRAQRRACAGVIWERVLGRFIIESEDSLSAISEIVILIRADYVCDRLGQAVQETTFGIPPIQREGSS